MTTILAISGKKQSGKTTLANFLVPYFEEQGKSVKIYSFADPIKEFFVNSLGLQTSQVYGTDEEKNSLTKYDWESFPDYVRWDNSGKKWYSSHQQVQVGTEYSIWEKSEHPDKDFVGMVRLNGIPAELKEGIMTARELMQVFGTDIGRRMFSPDIWVNATFSNIAKDDFDIALIPDMRFPSEMSGIIKNKGSVVRLTRNICNVDNHPSETALDDFSWDDYSDIVRIVPSDASIEDVRIIAVNFINFTNFAKA